MELMGEGIHPVLTASKPPGVHPAFPGIYKYIYIYIKKTTTQELSLDLQAWSYQPHSLTAGPQLVGQCS